MSTRVRLSHQYFWSRGHNQPFGTDGWPKYQLQSFQRHAIDHHMAAIELAAALTTLQSLTSKKWGELTVRWTDAEVQTRGDSVLDSGFVRVKQKDSKVIAGDRLPGLLRR